LGKIIWAESTDSDLKEIYDYIALDSSVNAKQFLKSLVQAVDKLALFPRIGRIVPELKDQSFREIIFHGYRIVYKLSEDNDDIEIILIIHAARDMTKLLGL
jgi:toxin ParE1/3/4